jgi:hypothetical protein
LLLYPSHTTAVTLAQLGERTTEVYIRLRAVTRSIRVSDMTLLFALFAPFFFAFDPATQKELLRGGLSRMTMFPIKQSALRVE